MSKQTILLTFPATLKYSSLVRHMMDEIFVMVGFSKDWSNRLKLVADELFMNAVKYGSVEETGKVNIGMEYDSEGLLFFVEDEGAGKNKVTPEEINKIIKKNTNETQVTSTSGRGLAMITSLWTDTIEITPSTIGGIKVTFTKKVDNTPPPPSPMVQMQVDKFEEEKKTTTPATMEESTSKKGPTFLFKLKGEIDQLNIEKNTIPVEDQIKKMPKGSQLILDFTDVKFINSSFIGHLAAWYKSLKNLDGGVTVKNINQEVQDILNLVGLSHVLTFDK